MSLVGTLHAVIGALDGAGIPHMVAGSLASTYHGEPRATQDIDLVIDPPSADALARFVSALDRDRFYVGDFESAFARQDTFNVIDTESGWKVDLIIRRNRAYSRTEFGRRRDAVIEGMRLSVASAEDTILSKLEWARLGESERQLRDVAAVVRTARDSLDREYLATWAKVLGVDAELDAVLRRD